MKKALITGIGGQDGSYLTELLLSKGYEVHGVETSSVKSDKEHKINRLSQIYDKTEMHYDLLEDYDALKKLIERLKPAECYHLSAKSFVDYKFSRDLVMSVMENNLNSTLNVLSALREVSPLTRMYFAGSSEMFGHVDNMPQNEETCFNPRSPYGLSKTTGYYLAKNFRRLHSMFICCGILYNHESPRRDPQFITRKITQAAAKIKLGIKDKLQLGNLDARRDWGFAPDYVKAMWLMLNRDAPDDYVVSSGETHTIREFVETVFSFAGYEIEWKGKDINEKGIDKNSGKILIEINTEYFRPSEKITLYGDSSKAKHKLNWRSEVSFNQMARIMYDADLSDLNKERGIL